MDGRRQQEHVDVLLGWPPLAVEKKPLGERAARKFPSRSEGNFIHAVNMANHRDRGVKLAARSYDNAEQEADAQRDC